VYGGAPSKPRNAEPTCSPPQPGCCSLAPLLPQTAQRSDFAGDLPKPPGWENIEPRAGHQGHFIVASSAETRSGEAETRVFISYSRKDMAFAGRLEAALKARGFEVLIDRQEIYAFEDWWKRIEALIGRADTVVFVLSPDAVTSSVALKEVAYAASLNKRLAPIVCRRVEDGAVPEVLRRLNFIFFDDAEQFGESTNKLADALETDINWIRQHTEYGEAERRWSAAGMPNGLLLQSPTLEFAEHWLATRPSNAPAPTRDIQSYLITSRRRARTSQRIWRGILASTFTLLVGVIAVLVAWINQDYLKAQWRWYTVTLPYAQKEVRPHVVSAEKERALKAGDSFKECARDCPEMVVIPAGSFTMGGPTEFEKPEHAVTIAKAFAVSKYELTFADWEACIVGGGCNGYRPSDQNWGRGGQPLINVNWDDAQHYVAWLKAATGKTYRLLTEAEFEYAARAGMTTRYPWGNEVGKNNAACNACGSRWDGEQTAPVGSFPPNKFGLYDMVGNVWQWTEDCFHKDYKGAPTNSSAWLADNGTDCTDHIVRAGCWDNPPSVIRSANRGWTSTGARDKNIGFRIARTLDVP
jgi:formylglycine-generating enzyme required for sulfatase activity